MSLSYNLYFKEKITVVNLIENFLIENNIEYGKELNEKSIFFDVYDNLGFIMYIFFIERNYFNYKVGNYSVDYEWDNCTYVSFDIDKFFDTKQIKINLIEIIIALLKETSEDAVLLFNGDSLILNRKNYIVSINEENGFWTFEDLLMKVKREL